MLDTFLETGLDQYAGGRNDASQDAHSNLSPYLHYGQLSSLRILLDIMKMSPEPPQIFRSFKIPSFDGQPSEQDGIDAFIEELIVRKELADNFCFYNPHYDSLDGAKGWAKKSLAEHADDPREFVYTKDQLEAARTHDDLWNAAQSQLVKTGKIHGYMRMYWAKKILEWTDAPADAIKLAVQLNDTYHLDGGDPNGYVGVLWSIAGIHDRPWFNRSVYGTVRYMSAGGISKKFDTKQYICRWLDKHK
jgi:deoxyribodipyrimidine photo-lyase